MACLVRCLSCLFCDTLCCECNCIIFPSPHCGYELDQKMGQEGDDIRWKYSSFNSVSNRQMQEGRQVPYLQISSNASRKSKKCFIYFHGNAEDIGYVGNFLQPIVSQLNVTFYAIEYPSYGQYSSLSGALISNTIKEDSINFYEYLRKMGRTEEDIYVMGRSIGSGGASYLSGNRPVPVLILMSPFDTIKKVASGMLGCLAGICVKQHFNNEQQIVKFNGKLLIIHGESDQVIKVTHGKNLVDMYQKQNPYKISATKVYPRRMTHNNFDLMLDIIAPIAKFLKFDLKE